MTSICLQEIQQTAYVKIVQQGLRAWPHLAWHANHWAPMGGLVTLSRHPIVRSEFVPFPNRGRWLGMGVSDWALRKGVLVVHVAVGGQPVVVLNTHLQANYRGDWASQNGMAQIQLDQVRVVAELARAQPADTLVFLAGDFNFPRATHLYEALLASSGLTDPLRHDRRPTYVPFPLVPRRLVAGPGFRFISRAARDPRWPWRRTLFPSNIVRAAIAFSVF